MSTYHLVNRIKIADPGGVRTFWPGALIDDSQDPASAIQAAGGVLIASSDATIATAALIAQGLVARGQFLDAAFVMMSAATVSSAGDDLTTSLASTATGKGASLIGIEDAGTFYSGVTVEAALSEAETKARLSSTANGKGASLVGIEDAAGNTAAATVEASLAELYGFNKQLIQSGTATLSSGVTAAISATVTANTRIIALPKDQVSASLTVKYAALAVDRVVGAPGSFKLTALVAAGTLNNADGSSLDWIAIG